MVEESSRLPRNNLRPLVPSLTKPFPFTFTDISAKKIIINKKKKLETEKIQKRKNYHLSNIMRFKLIRSPIGEESSSEPMGIENIPSPRSINSINVSVSSINSTETTVENLFPFCRYPLHFAIANFANKKWKTKNKTESAIGNVYVYVYRGSEL